MKKNVAIKILPLFYIFCFICIVISIFSIYNIKQEEKNRLLTIGNELNISSTGETVDLELSDNNINEEVIYEVKDESIVKVENDGTLVSVGEGSTEIIVTNKDKTKKQIVKVNVGETAIKESTINKNNTSTNTDTSSSQADTSTKTDTSSNQDDTSTNKNETTSTQTNTSTNKNDTSTNTGNVTVSTKTNIATNKNNTSSNKQISVTGVKLNKNNAEIFLNSSNKTISLTATISPSNASNKEIIWTSSNSEIASVSNGVVTAKSPGVAVITAKTKDGNKTASMTITVKKKIIIVIGASQVTRMATYNKNNYSSSKYNYSTNDGTLIYIYKNGSGIDYQTSTGLNNANNIINSYSNVKNQTFFYIYFPLSGNTIKNFTCKEISTSNNSIKNYAQNYNKAIQSIKNNGYNVKGYVVSMHPVKVSQSNNSKVVKNEDENACTAGYRSNYKYYKFNRAIRSIIQSNYSSNLKYESLFIKIMDVKGGNQQNYSYKISYNTTDGIHWDSTTTHNYVDMMLGYTNDL